MKKQATDQTQEILNSLDGIKRIPAPDFFYTRLKAKMLARQTGGETLPPSKQNSRIFRPAYVMAFLVLLIAFNLISLIKQNNEQNNTTSAEPENLQTIASAYNLDDNFSYELNQ